MHIFFNNKDNKYNHSLQQTFPTSQLKGVLDRESQIGG